MNVTVIIVSYNQPQLLADCVNSIRRFYPTLPMVVVDGSPPQSPCHTYAAGLRNQHTLVIQPGYNIGHGRGMVKGIGSCQTRFILLVDSDVVITCSGVIEQMVARLEASPKAYGIGPVVTVDRRGLMASTGVPYLHPHFAMIRRVAYQRHAPIIHHGAPLIRAMCDLKMKRLNYLIPFTSPCVVHRERGTRNLNPQEFHPRTWDRV